MHILILPSEHFLTQWSPLGGIFQLDLARGLRHLGHQVAILSVGRFPARLLFRKKKYTKSEIISGIPIYRRYVELPIPLKFDKQLLLSNVLYFITVRLYDKYVVEFGRPDIIHAHNFIYAGAIASKISKSRNVPFVVTEHSSAYNSGQINYKTGQLLSSIGKTASGISAVSRDFSKTLSRVIKLESSTIAVIPNSLPEEFTTIPLSSPSNSRGEPFIFINVAELVPIKNHILLITAFANSFKNMAVFLRIIGDGPCMQNLVKLAGDLGVSGQIQMLGRLKRSQILDHMRESDAFAFSSDSETFGVALIEAHSQGLPTVSTNCGGPSDIVNVENGILVDPGDVVRFGDAMQEMYKERNKYNSTIIYKQCRDKYLVKTVANHYVDFYRKAISNFLIVNVRDR